MITNSTIEIAENIYKKNETFNIPNAPERARHPLSAAIITYKNLCLLSSQACAMNKLYRQAISYLPSYKGWLLLSNGGMVKNSRIVDYYRLWGGLSKAGITFPEGQKTPEHILKHGNDAQYFGAINLDNPNFLQIARLISDHSSTHLLLSNNSESIEKILSTGWKYGSRKYPDELLSLIEIEDIFFIIPIGEFDDVEGGSAVIAKPHLIQKCYKI